MQFQIKQKNIYIKNIYFFISRNGNMKKSWKNNALKSPRRKHILPKVPTF